VKIGPVDTEIALLIIKKKKLRKVKYIALSASLRAKLVEPLQSFEGSKFTSYITLANVLYNGLFHRTGVGDA